jgi:hypothetical protein
MQLILQIPKSFLAVLRKSFLCGCFDLAQLSIFCSFVYASCNDHKANWNHLLIFDNFQPEYNILINQKKTYGHMCLHFFHIFNFFFVASHLLFHFTENLIAWFISLFNIIIPSMKLLRLARHIFKQSIHVT